MSNTNYIYYYPAIFKQTDDEYKVKFIDFNLGVCGTNLLEAIKYTERALESHIIQAFDFPTLLSLPKPTHDIQKFRLQKNEAILLIKIDISECRKKYGTKSVRKDVSIPSWLCYLAEKENINFSQMLQEALKKHLNIE